MVPRVEPAIQGPPAIRGRETFVDMYSSTQNHGSVENKSSNIYFLWKMSGNFPLPWLWEKGNSKLWNSNSTGFMILDDLILGFCDVFAVQSWLAIKLSLEVLGFASGGCVFQDMRGAVVYTTVIFQQSNIAIKIQWPVYMLYIVVLCFCQMYALLERINAERKFWSSIPCLNQTCCFSFCLDASNSIVNMTSTFNGSKTTIYKVMATYQIVSLFWYLSAHVGLCRDVAASQFFSGWSLSLDHKLWSFDVIFKATYTAPMEAEFRVVFLLAFNWKFDSDLMTLMFRNVLKGVSTFFTTRRHVNLDAPQSLWALPKDQWLNAHIYIYIQGSFQTFQNSKPLIYPRPKAYASHQ